MLPILRRVLLAAGLLSATWLAFHVEPLLVRLSLEDTAALYEKGYGQRNVRQEVPFEPLAAFVNDRLKGRAYTAAGQEWRKLFADLSALTASPSSVLASRRGRGPADRAVFFAPGDPPLAEITPGLLASERNFAYVRLATPQGLRLARLSVVRAGDMVATAPDWLAHPYRHLTPWALLAGIAAYVLVPWRRRAAGHALRHRRLKAVILPDLAAAVAASVLFGIPFVVVGTYSASGILLDFAGEGWGFLTLPLWLAAAMAGSFLVRSARNEALQLVIEPQGLRRLSLLSDHKIGFADMRRAEYVEIRPSYWLRAVMTAAGAVSWRAAGQVLRNSPPWGIAITETGGRRTRIEAGLPGLAGLVDALEAARVPIEGLDAIRGALIRKSRRPEQGATGASSG